MLRIQLVMYYPLDFPNISKNFIVQDSVNQSIEKYFEKRVKISLYKSKRSVVLHPH